MPLAPLLVMVIFAPSKDVCQVVLTQQPVTWVGCGESLVTALAGVEQ